MFFFFWTILAAVAMGLAPSSPPAPAGIAPIPMVAAPGTPASPSAPAGIRPIPMVAAPGSPASPSAPAGIAPIPMVAAPATPATPSAPAAPGLTAEPQIPTGRFTTATEVRPILDATKSVWVALRDYDGQDLLYVTHLWSWRCGLAAMAVSINGAAPDLWDLPPCHEETATPNAITDADGLPFRPFPAGFVQSVTVTLIYDDLSRDSASYQRAQILMP